MNPKIEGEITNKLDFIQRQNQEVLSKMLNLLILSYEYIQFGSKERFGIAWTSTPTVFYYHRRLLAQSLKWQQNKIDQKLQKYHFLLHHQVSNWANSNNIKLEKIPMGWKYSKAVDFRFERGITLEEVENIKCPEIFNKELIDDFRIAKIKKKEYKFLLQRVENEIEEKQIITTILRNCQKFWNSSFLQKKTKFRNQI
jgi:hypothetical protein